MARSKAAAEAGHMDPGWRNESGEPFDEFHAAESQVGGPVAPAPFEFDQDVASGGGLEPLQRGRVSGHVP